MALLKRDHGIEVKSASSTIEEVVGRQFVERLARQRGVSLPGGDMFAERPMPSSGKKPMPGRKPEPPKPAAPTLGPPRLVKTITRPVQPTPVDEDAECVIPGSVAADRDDPEHRDPPVIEPVGGSRRQGGHTPSAFTMKLCRVPALFRIERS